MKKFISNSYTLTFLGILLFFGLWFILSLCIGEETLIFPGPIATLEYAVQLLKKEYIYLCIAATMKRMLIGFIIAFAIAFILGMLAGQWKAIQKVLQPLVTACKAVPTACLIFLFLVLLGAKNAAIGVVILVSWPILYEAIVGGMHSTSEDMIRAARIDGSNAWKIMTRIRFPLSLPYWMVGIASSFALSFKIEIMAEILTGNTRLGLGAAIYSAQQNDPSNMVPIFAYSIIAIFFILLVSFLGRLCKKEIEKKLLKK